MSVELKIVDIREIFLNKEFKKIFPDFRIFIFQNEENG